MKLTFVGTRGEIEARTLQHGMHTSMLTGYRGRNVMIDCGLDWKGQFCRLRPRAIVITHAHPDHAWGLQDGADCSVYATPQSWELMKDYPVADRQTIRPRQPVDIQGITFEAFEVEHSTRCPAVGYRISAGRASVFYVPDLVFIHERSAALADVDLYVGDGATLKRPMVRRQGDRLVGHSPIRTQLGWCQKEHVRRAIFTHCGSAIVTANQDEVARELAQMAQQRGVEATFAHDGMAVRL